MVKFGTCRARVTTKIVKVTKSKEISQCYDRFKTRFQSFRNPSISNSLAIRSHTLFET